MTLDERTVTCSAVPVRRPAHWPSLAARRPASVSSRSTRSWPTPRRCSAAYDLPLETGANCVVVAGSRDGEERVAACLVRADTRADVNNLVKRLLDVRKASFLAHGPRGRGVGMEYGGITPVGLPPAWRLLVDARCRGHRRGGHRLRACAAPSCCVPGALLAELARRRGRRGPRRLSQVVAHRSRGSHRRPASSSHRPRTAGDVTITRDDVVLGLAFLLAFPVAINLTAWAAPEPTRARRDGRPRLRDPVGEPDRVPGPRGQPSTPDNRSRTHPSSVALVGAPLPLDHPGTAGPPVAGAVPVVAGEGPVAHPARRACSSASSG